MARKHGLDLRRLETLNRDHPGRRLSFIVTLRAGAGSASVEKEGMQVERRIDEPPLLIGTMTPEQALAVAQLDDVVIVEADEGGVHALDE